MAKKYMAKKYKVAPGVAITANGRIYSDGDEVSKNTFSVDGTLEKLVKSKKVVECKEEDSDESENPDEGGNGGDENPNPDEGGNGGE